MSFREKFFNSVNTPRFKDFDTPWGRIRVKALTGGESDALIKRQAREKSDIRRRALLVIATVIEPDAGTPLFTEDDLDDLSAGQAWAVNALSALAIDVNSADEWRDAEGSSSPPTAG